MIRRAAGVLRSLVVYWRPGRQPALRRLYAPFVETGDVVFDVGAHLGDRTAAFSALGASVVALEPQPHLARWLERLVGRRPGVTIRREAVGAQVGEAELALSEANPTVSTLAREWRRKIGTTNPSFRGVRWDRRLQVPVTTLDALVDEFGEPSFCKIDVEGYEAEVLAGLSRPLAALSVEFVAGSLSVATACIRRLESLGEYRYNVILGEGRRFRFPEWREARLVEAWFDSGAEGASSGDLYARRVDGGQPSTDPPGQDAPGPSGGAS